MQAVEAAAAGAEEADEAARTSATAACGEDTGGTAEDQGTVRLAQGAALAELEVDVARFEDELHGRWDPDGDASRPSHRLPSLYQQQRPGHAVIDEMSRQANGQRKVCILPTGRPLPAELGQLEHGDSNNRGPCTRHGHDWLRGDRKSVV